MATASSLSVGLQIDALAPLDRLTVHTTHSRYDMIVVCPATGRVLMRGGQHSPRFTNWCVAGSSFDGGDLKPYGIYVGCPLVLICDGDGIVTSCVKAIEHIPASGPDWHTQHSRSEETSVQRIEPKETQS